MAESKIKIRELKPINIEGGFVIDGLPSVGITNAIATESLINTSGYELAAILDSEIFPPIAMIKEGIPNYPTNIFVNNKLKIAVFSSQLTIPESLHREAAKLLLSWGKDHKCSLIISSVPIETPIQTEDGFLAAGSTESANSRLKDAKIDPVLHGTIPGIPGLLLNEGKLENQDVIVIIFNPAKQKQPDFKTSAKLCGVMSKLIPGASCNISMLEKIGEKMEVSIKKTETETKHLKHSIYK